MNIYMCVCFPCYAGKETMSGKPRCKLRVAERRPRSPTVQ